MSWLWCRVKALISLQCIWTLSVNSPPANLQSQCVVVGILCHSKGPLDYIILEVEIPNDMTFPLELGSTVSEQQPFEDIFLIGRPGNLGPKETNQDCKLIHAESELKRVRKK